MGILDYVRWPIRVVLVLSFLVVGWAKLTGDEAIYASLAHLGYPAWAGYAIGALEVLGALGLLVPRFRAWAAMGLAVLMVGAVLSHVVANDPVWPSLVLLMLLMGLLALERWRAATVAAQ